MQSPPQSEAPFRHWKNPTAGRRSGPKCRSFRNKAGQELVVRQISEASGDRECAVSYRHAGIGWFLARWRLMTLSIHPATYPGAGYWPLGCQPTIWGHDPVGRESSTAFLFRRDVSRRWGGLPPSADGFRAPVTEMPPPVCTPQSLRTLISPIRLAVPYSIGPLTIACMT